MSEPKDSQPVPVEPEIGRDVNIQQYPEAMRKYIDTLQSELRRVTDDRDALHKKWEETFGPVSFGEVLARIEAAESLNRRMVELLRRLSFLAQTTGGTAGRDADLVAAINEAEQLLKEVGGMKVKIEIELQPFTVPNYVLTVGKVRKREDGFTESPKYHLSELDPITLSNMCDDFRAEVFRKAGKEQPPEAR